MRKQYSAMSARNSLGNAPGAGAGHKSAHLRKWAVTMMPSTVASRQLIRSGKSGSARNATSSTGREMEITAARQYKAGVPKVNTKEGSARAAAPATLADLEDR